MFYLGSEYSVRFNRRLCLRAKRYARLPQKYYLRPQKKLMKKAFTLILFLLINNVFAQVRGAEIVTKQGDTLKNVTLKMSQFSRITLIRQLQESIVYIDNSGNKIKLLPSDVKAFRVNYSGEIMKFENIEDRGFAHEMYSNKVKLFRVVNPNVNIYIIKRPDGKVSYMEAMGFSQLISEKVIAREMIDCPETVKRVQDDILKVRGEKGVIELIQDYESTCFQ